MIYNSSNFHHNSEKKTQCFFIWGIEPFFFPIVKYEYQAHNPSVEVKYMAI